MVYKKLRVDLTEAQVLKALSGKPIRINPGQINTGEQFVSFHPENSKKIEKAFLAKKGVNVFLSHGELLQTASDMTGKGFWGNVWNKIKQGWKALKDNGIITKLADAAVPVVATYTGSPALASGARELFRGVAGAGVIPETKQKKKRICKADKYAQLKGSGIFLS